MPKVVGRPIKGTGSLWGSGKRLECQLPDCQYCKPKPRCQNCGRETKSRRNTKGTCSWQCQIAAVERRKIYKALFDLTVTGKQVRNIVSQQGR